MIWLDWFWLLCCLVWCARLVKTTRVLRGVPLFEEYRPDPPGEWPSLSVVIPARNEARSVEKTVHTLLAQDYPRLEIILINDRSSDETGALMDALAAVDTRVRVFHVAALPDGWIGKVHALEFGARNAIGDWLLFTDADVRYKQDTLRTAMAHVLSQNVEHLTLMPAFRGASFFMDVTTGAFERTLLTESNAATAGVPGSKAVVGIGAFNLIRTAALDRSRGLSWLRMEVVDDMGLAVLMREAGAQSLFASAKQHLALTWYASVSDMFKGLEKNAFSALHYQTWRLVLFLLLSWTMFLAPHAILFSSIPYLWVGGIAVYLFLVPVGLIWRLRFHQRFLPVLLTPVAVIVLSLILLRAGILCLYRGGVRWRGTFYSLEQLREGQRFFF